MAQDNLVVPTDKKRKRASPSPAPEAAKAIPRRIATVLFGWYEITPWYESPYPLDDLLPVEKPKPKLLATPKKKIDKRPRPIKAKILPPPKSISPRILPPRNKHGHFARSNKKKPKPEVALTEPSPSRAIEPSVEAPAEAREEAVPLPEASTSTLPSPPRSKPRVPKRDLADLAVSAPPAAPTEGSKLYVCDGCLKYMAQEAVYVSHRRTCKMNKPPGKKVYERGAHIIWEVDGADQKLWCQNLALFGKLFILHKYICFDVQGFMFYVMTDAQPSKDHILGFFSKEKTSYENYNLACIITLPPYQRKGYGHLLIEFSYELNKRLATPIGTPERPLSDLGQRSYRVFWLSIIVRYLRLHFSSPPPEEPATPATATTEPRRSTRRTKAEEKAMTLADLALACFLRTEDVGTALLESGVPLYTRQVEGKTVLWMSTSWVEELATKVRVRNRILQNEFMLV